MGTLSTTITATASLADKSITFASRLAVYETRAVSIVVSASDSLPSGTYKLLLTFGARSVALSALSASTGTLTGTLNLSTTQLDGLFAVLPVERIRCVAHVWDTTGKVLWARGGVDVWRNDYDETASAPVAVRNDTEQGIATISAGASSVTVTMTTGTVLDTASVAGSVIVPSGSDNIFVVGVTTAASGGYLTQIVFQLSSPPAASGYKLSWMTAQ